MSDKPSAFDMIQAMLIASSEAETADDMPMPGTFARRYAEGAREDIDADTVKAFTHGSAIINLLVQEAILRVARVANETGHTKATTDEGKAYAAGVQDGATLIAQIMAATADQIIMEMIEGPAFDRAFNGIVNNYK